MYRALVSFSGRISMAVGEVREISDKAVVKDLLNAKYIEEVKTENPVSEKPEEEKPKASTEKKTSAKKKSTTKKTTKK